MPARNGPPSKEPERDLAKEEALARIAKLEIEQKKLQLEFDDLCQKRSPMGRLAELFRVVTLPAALAGVLVTAVLGINQSRLAQDARADERLDKAVTRTAGADERDRVTGVSGLRLFVTQGDAAHRAQALHSLVDAAASEASESVQDAIAAVFADLPPSVAPVPALNDALEAALDHNRSLTVRALGIVEADKQAAQRLAVAHALNLEPASIDYPIPVSQLQRLQIEQLLDYRNAGRAPLAYVAPAVRVPLTSLSNLIIALLRAGARSRNFSGIYCELCVFPASVDYSSVSFAGAYLQQAKFVNATLRAASFRDADIAFADFYNADLRAADLRVTRFFSPPVLNRMSRSSFPVLKCADLRGADLTGMPIVELRRNRTDSGMEYSSEALEIEFARIDSTTTLGGITVLSRLRVSDEVLKHPSLPGDADYASGLRDETHNDMLVQNDNGPYQVYRRAVSFGQTDDASSNTEFARIKTLTREDVERIYPEKRQWVADTLNRPDLVGFEAIFQAIPKLGQKPVSRPAVGRRPGDCPAGKFPG